MKNSSTTLPDVSSTRSQLEVILSRTCYRVGGTLVGSLRLIIPFSDPSQNPLETSDNVTTSATDNNSSGIISRNSYWEEATVHARGQCRLDPRWHNPLAYDQYRNLSAARTDVAQSREEEDPNVCTVWKTNTVSLLTLTERKLGKWLRVRPRPLSMPPENPEHYFTERINGYENLKDEDESEDPSLNLENRQLCFTFRVHLPEDLIPSVSLTCCRYSYHIHVEAKTKTGIHLVEQIPFTVWSALSPREVVTLPKFDGQCLAMAHSSGLPCYLSTDEIYAPQGQMTVINRNSKWDTKNLRITDPSGNHCCQVTAFGSQIMSPGVGQLLLQFDFDTDTICYGVSACLESEEIALRHYTERTNSSQNERERERRTSTQWWDTQHEPVEPGFTDRVTLRLHLPPESPISVMTDVVRLQYVCRIDITVSTSPAGRFTSFSWTLPIHVVHPATAEELEQSHECNRDPWETEDVWNKEASEPITSVTFPTQDIMADLKILSRILLEKCDLLKESRRFEV